MRAGSVSWHLKAFSCVFFFLLAASRMATSQLMAFYVPCHRGLFLGSIAAQWKVSQEHSGSSDACWRQWFDHFLNIPEMDAVFELGILFNIACATRKEVNSKYLSPPPVSLQLPETSSSSWFMKNCEAKKALQVAQLLGILSAVVWFVYICRKLPQSWWRALELLNRT